MSLFAKIMVVVNLILAVAFLAAAGTFLNATENWKERHGKDTAALSEENDNLKQQRDAQSQQKEAAIAEKSAAQGRATSAEDRLSVLQNSNSDLMAQINKLQASLETLTTTQGDLQSRNTELNTEIERQRGELSTAQADNRQLQDQNRTATENIARLEQENADTSGNLAAQEAANGELTSQLDAVRTEVAQYRHMFGPMVDKVQKDITAVVQAVDNENDIYILSVGSKDGVEEGYKFTVSRGSDYIATVVVDKVFPNHASARTKGNLKKKAARPGDNASTH